MTHLINKTVSLTKGKEDGKPLYHVKVEKVVEYNGIGLCIVGNFKMIRCGEKRYLGKWHGPGAFPYAKITRLSVLKKRKTKVK